MKDNSKKILHLFKTSKSIALFGHTSPDGDCIWSMLWLGKILEKQEKKVSYFTPTKPSRLFDFLPKIKKIKTKFDYKSYDLIVFVDFSSYSRLRPFTEKDNTYFGQKNIVVIDHHPDDKLPSHAIIHKDVDAMSTAEIIFELAQKLRKKYLDKEIATDFYLGLVTDSGNFLFDQDHERIFQNALALVQLGADKKFINNNIIRKKSLNQIQFLGEMIKRIQIQGNILCSYYEKKDLQKYNIDEEEAGYGLVVMQNIDGPKVTAMFKKNLSAIKCSLRCKDNAIDCNSIAKNFGWWGHPWAAWFEVPASTNFAKQIKTIIAQINSMIKK